MKNKLSMNNLMNRVVRYGSQIIFVVALIVLAYISFVEDFEVSNDIQRIGVIALIGVVLNYVVWDTQYKSNYEREIQADINNEKYSIHKRYYLARHNWNHDDLQYAIRDYNKRFKEAWIVDLEDLTGYSREQLKGIRYRDTTNKFSVWRYKHNKFPKTGIRAARQLLSILAVGKSGSMKVNVNAAEKQLWFGRIRKIIMSLCSVTLSACIIVQFIEGDYSTAIFTLLVNIACLVSSALFGAMSGSKGARIKLSTAEEVSELLEEWKQIKPTEVPYDKPLEVVTVMSPEIKVIEPETTDTTPKKVNKLVIN